jgi:hypothetical protein
MADRSGDGLCTYYHKDLSLQPGAALRLSLCFDNSPEYRALRSVADYRASFAEQVQEVSDRIIKAEPVLRIRQSSSKASA